MKKGRHKVADKNLQQKLQTYHHLSPPAPPPRLVEERETHQPSPQPPPRWKKFARKYDPIRRSERKRANRITNAIQKNDSTAANANARIDFYSKLLDDLERSLATEWRSDGPPEDESLEAAAGVVMESKLPTPPGWNTTREHELEFINATECISEDQLKEMIINGTIDTAIADAGASSSCGVPLISECGGYKLKGNPFIETGRRSDKIFQYAGGGLAPATEIQELPYKVRGQAKDVHITPGIKNNLISTNRFALENYIHIFDKEQVNVYDANDVKISTTRGAVLRGWRVPSQGLWRFPLVKNAQKICNLNTETAFLAQDPQEVLKSLPPPVFEGVNNVYDLKAKPELVRYYHAAAGFPTKPTWLKAIKNGHYASWPGLNATDASKYFPESVEMWKGHGRKIKSGLRSTKQLVEEEERDAAKEPPPVESAIHVREYDLQDEMDRKIFTDQTGKFPVTSYRGMRYVMVLYETTTSNILVEAMRDRSSREMLRAYQTLIDRLHEKNIHPKQHILDNECSTELKEAIKNNKMTYQLVPPHDHRRNTAEKAIQTFKGHFIAVLCGADESFPLQLWCMILRQAEHQLNLLRKSRRNPAISAFEEMYGPHDYNAHPFGILGCAVELHVMPDNRKSWETHTKTGFYVGTSWEHYRCHQVWVQDTKSTRVGQTVFFRHKYITQPTVTASDALLRASEDICDALLKASPKNPKTRSAIDLLVDIFKGKSNDEETTTDRQRQRRRDAHSQRVALEEAQKEEEGDVLPSLVSASEDDSVSSTETEDGSQRVGSGGNTKCWTRTDPNSKCFMTTKKGGPKWKHVQRRVTIAIDSGDVIEDIQITEKTTDKHLHRQLPKGTSGTITVLYHSDPDLDDSAAKHRRREHDDGDLRMEGLTVEYTNDSANNEEANPAIISQYELGPSQNTRAARRERLHTALEVSDTGLSAKQMSARKFPQQFILDYASAVLDEETGELLEYRHLIKNPKYKKDWGYSFGNEIGRLAQGMPGRTKGTNTLYFIHKHEIPSNRWRDVANGRIVCDVRPQKAEKNRTRLTADGSRINIDLDCGTPTASLLTVKLLLNSVISTPGAKFMCLDLKDFYLNTPMERPEYLRLRYAHFPQDVIDHYQLKDKVDPKGYLYVKAVRGMYGLPHAGIIAQELLTKRLEKHGYYQSETTPGFWRHKTRPICFSLIVDDFGVKYVGKEHAEHLVNVLKEHYKVSEDWKGEKFSGIAMDWDYIARKVHLSMPGYCKEALVRFGHKLRKDTHQPHKHTEPTYGSKIQYAKGADESPKLNEQDKKFIQQVTGTFLYYARAVDPTMLVALSAIASEQAAPTEATMEKAKLFLDYVATHPDAVLTYTGWP